jgi:hypothetical protein
MGVAGEYFLTGVPDDEVRKESVCNYYIVDGRVVCTLSVSQFIFIILSPIFFPAPLHPPPLLLTQDTICKPRVYGRRYSRGKEAHRRPGEHRRGRCCWCCRADPRYRPFC